MLLYICNYLRNFINTLSIVFILRFMIEEINDDNKETIKRNKQIGK